ncbi:MAG: hypothetical protein M3Q11_08240 [Pseudomonadota bacterium]|nr:hypothetical protein [Pseudomonadota bacterium]
MQASGLAHQRVDRGGDPVRMVFGGEMPASFDALQWRPEIARETFAVFELLERVGGAHTTLAGDSVS